MRFFTADTHFSLNDYKGVIKRDFRPFKTNMQMNKKIISIWNKQAGKNDVIYHLGDFANYNSFDETSYSLCLKFVKKIKAKVILICGNNEERIIKKVYNGDFEKFKSALIEMGFKDVYKDNLQIEIDGKPVNMVHRPADHKQGMENLFGHIHNCVFVKPYGFNVGVDNHYLKLFTENEIIDMFSRRTIYDENVYN